MATVKNHKITGTLRSAVAYILKDKKEKADEGISSVVAYAINDKEGTITYATRRSTINCAPGDPAKSFERLMDKFGREEMECGNRQTKDGKPVIAWHYIQSFDSKIDPETAHEIGRKFAAEMFPGHPVVIGTHTNTEHTHNHFIVCAWALDGHKWHQHNKVYQKAREVSDRLCEEYGLGVLEKTKKQKLVRWTDKDGNIHYYEPTDRKNEEIEKRSNGELTKDRIGSYRNSLAYDMKESEKLTNREITRRDIDRLLPSAQSYDHLLFLLRQNGYKVKAKKSNGDYLKYVTFTPPEAERGTRDSSLGEHYTRKNLEKVIAENVKRQTEYIYGTTDFSTVSDTYRANSVPRGEAEKAVLRSIRKDDKEIKGLIDTAKLKEMIEEQKKYGTRMTEGKAAYLIGRLQESCKALTVMERENLFSLKQITQEVKDLRKQCNEAEEKIKGLTGPKAKLLKDAIKEQRARIEDLDTCVKALKRIEKNRRSEHDR